MVPYGSTPLKSRMTTTRWIDTPQALTEAIACWQGRDWLTVDTEFLRVDTYRPKLCLIQIGDGVDAWVIDCIAIADLSALFARLNETGPVKVFHAASQDLEIFAQLTGRCPSPVFDTQLAASLLGIGDQLGRRFGRGNPGRAIADQGRADVGLIEQHLTLEQFELEPDRPQLLAQHEVVVAERQLVGRAAGLRGGVILRFDKAGFLLGLVEAAMVEPLFLVLFCHCALFACPAAAVKTWARKDRTRRSKRGRVG